MPSDQTDAGGPLDPAPSSDRADGSPDGSASGRQARDRRRNEADAAPSAFLGDSSPGGAPTEEFTSEGFPIEQDSSSDSG